MKEANSKNYWDITEGRDIRDPIDELEWDDTIGTALAEHEPRKKPKPVDRDLDT